MDKIILGAIITIFPILIYLVFSCYNAFFSGICKRVIFIITLGTSLYLNMVLNAGMLFFCNIPIIICYYKKEVKLSLLLSLVVILYSHILYNINIYVLFIEYSLYYIAYLLLFRKRIFNSFFLYFCIIIQGIFIFDKIFNVIEYTIFMYFLTVLILYLFKLADDICNLYVSYTKVLEDNKLKDSLFKLTHEIKNPIAVCKGYLDMINLNDRGKTIKYINIIKSEIDRSLNVISEFVDYNKIKINKDIMDIVMLVDEVYDSFKLLSGSKHIKFVYHNDYDEIFLMGDYDRLKQVFINIIKNSIESIENNGIINVDIDKFDGEVIITVKDSGKGMDEEELNNIKKLFFTTKSNGTGLGVALSNEIVLAHHGELIYNSEKNKGTKCIIKLPI